MSWRVVMTKRRKRECLMAYPFSEARLNTYKKPWLVQPKLDGIRCIADINGNDVTLKTSTGIEIVTVPHVNEELRKMNIQAKLDGELYLHGNFQRLCSIVKRNYALHPDTAKEVKYIVFDSISDRPQLERLAWAIVAFHGHKSKYVELLDTETVESIEELNENLSNLYEGGYEGVVIRHAGTDYKLGRSTEMMKIKPTKTDEYVIYGYKEEHDQHGIPKGTLGSFVCGFENDDPFSVGSGLTQEQRVDFWNRREELIGATVVVKYQELTRYGIPRFPVLIEVKE